MCSSDLFLCILLYQRFWRIQRHVAGFVERRWAFHSVAEGSALFIVALLILGQSARANPGALVGILVGGSLAGWGYGRVLELESPPSRIAQFLMYAAVMLIVVLASVFVIRYRVLSLPMAAVAALSPLLGTPIGTVMRERRRRHALSHTLVPGG